MTDGAEAVGPLVVCAGQVVADLFVPPLAALPEAGELVTTGDMLSGVGGCSANTAVALASFGVRTLLSVVVGADAAGDWVRAHLAAKGLDVSGVVTSDRLATSQTVILPVTGQDRRYLHAVGANAEYSAAHAAAVAAGARVLVIGGFLSLPGLTTPDVAALLAQARAAGTRTVLDVVIPHGTRDAAERLAPVLPHVDCFTPNDDEARLLTGETDPHRQAATLLDWGAASVVITRGPDGAVYADREQVVAVRPLPVAVVDGSGAGDAFTAGLVFGLVHDWPVERRLRFAAAAGASVTRALGTTTSLFSRDEAIAALDDVPLLEMKDT
ncbi:carbohydrate kinase family protein [Jiangella anatolica]|nr:carbohydrate kinase family protein [Jiangella anatolica]